MKSTLDTCGRRIRSLLSRLKPRGMGRRGAVALTFAIAAVPIAMATATAVDFSRIAAGRAALQRAADNAALSGAAAYTVYAKGDTFKAVAVRMATTAFCNTTRALPGGFTINASTASADSQTCGIANGPAVSGVIAGYVTGTPRIAVNSGCSATNTVAAGYKCGFVVTVTVTAKTTTMFAGLLGASSTLSVSGMAINPFIDLANALTPSFAGGAWNANSLWVYPLLLDANGQPDFSSNSGALPDASACTGKPTQTSCGEYSMVASTKYLTCTTANPCTTAGPCPTPSTCPAGATIFGGSGGIVQNIVASSAVITATTPLGVAFESATGGATTYPWDTGKGNPPPPTNGQPQPANNCTWPGAAIYSTVSQEFDAGGNALVVDKYGNWKYPTHWFYSSYLASKQAPSQRLINMQGNLNIDPDTNMQFRFQVILSVPTVNNGVNTPNTCLNPTYSSNLEKLVTTYPTTGSSNCSLYIVKNPPIPLLPDATYKANHTCFDPANTPGQEYAALSCQNYSGNSYAFFWNDMSGIRSDNYDYNDGTLLINCAATSKVILIN